MDVHGLTDFEATRWGCESASASPSLDATLAGRPLPGGVSPPKGLMGVDVGAGEIGRPWALACAWDCAMAIMAAAGEPGGGGCPGISIGCGAGSSTVLPTLPYFCSVARESQEVRPGGDTALRPAFFRPCRRCSVVDAPHFLVCEGFACGLEDEGSPALDERVCLCDDFPDLCLELLFPLQQAVPQVVSDGALLQEVLQRGFVFT